MDENGLNQGQKSFAADMQRATDLIIEKHLDAKADREEVATVLNKVREELFSIDKENDRLLKEHIELDTNSHLRLESGILDNKKVIDNHEQRLTSFQGTLGNHGSRVSRLEKRWNEFPKADELVTDTLSYLETTEYENKLDALSGLRNLKEAVEKYLPEIDIKSIRDSLENLKDDEKLSYDQLSNKPDIENIAQRVVADQIARMPYRQGTIRKLASLTDVDLTGVTVTDGKYVLGSGGGGSGHTIQEEGSSLTSRTNLNFIGPVITAADDAGNNATTVTVNDDLSAYDNTVSNFVAVGDSVTGLDGTADRILYINSSGDVTELALGSSGTYLKSQGATSAPTWDTPAGGGGGANNYSWFIS